MRWLTLEKKLEGCEQVSMKIICKRTFQALEKVAQKP